MERSRRLFYRHPWAGNDKLFNNLPWPQANGQDIVLFCQNDSKVGPDGLTANERWIQKVGQKLPFAYYPWSPPGPHKDFNDWTLAGVTEVELHEAWFRLKSSTKPIDPAPQAPPLFDILEDSTKSVSEFPTIVLPKRQIIFDDWFKESDLAFIYAPRGLGKTWMTVSLGIAISSGGQIGPWISQVSWPVLYVDGEMMWEDDRSRIFGLNGLSPDKFNFHVLNHEVLFHLHQTVLNLAAPEAQDAITELCLHRGIKALILDNLSCLFTGDPENDAEAWERVLPWLLDLRRRRIAVVIVHHTGINTLRMRGTSRREDGASWAMRLDMLENCGPGSHFISRFTKMRGKIAIPDYQ